MAFPFTYISDSETEELLTPVNNKITKISFKVRCITIDRQWLDPAILKIKPYKIPGFDHGSWSTGKIASDNNGVCPLYSTQMVIAKDIKVTTVKFVDHEKTSDILDSKLNVV